MAGTNKAGTNLANYKYSWWTAWLVFIGLHGLAGIFFGLNLLIIDELDQPLGHIRPPRPSEACPTSTKQTSDLRQLNHVKL